MLQGPYGWYLEASAASGQAKEESGKKAAEEGSKSTATGTKRKAKAKPPKPQRVSLGKLPAGQVPEITLEEAVELLQWPKVRARPPRTHSPWHVCNMQHECAALMRAPYDC